jgi:hypothetical protein
MMTIMVTLVPLLKSRTMRTTSLPRRSDPPEETSVVVRTPMESSPESSRMCPALRKWQGVTTTLLFASAASSRGDIPA